MSSSSGHPITHSAKEIGFAPGLLGRQVKHESERRGTYDALKEAILWPEDAHLHRDLAEANGQQGSTKSNSLPHFRTRRRERGQTFRERTQRGQAHLPACSLGMPAKSGRYSPRGELGTASIIRGPSRFGHKSNGRQRGPTGDAARQSHVLLSVRALRRDGQLGRLREPYRPSRNQNRDSWLTIG